MTAPAPPLASETYVFPLRFTAPSWLVSLVLHLAFLVLLALCYVTHDVVEVKQFLAALAPTNVPELIETPLLVPPPPLILPTLTTASSSSALTTSMEEIASEIEVSDVEVFDMELPIIVDVLPTDVPKFRSGPRQGPYADRDPTRRGLRTPHGPTAQTEKAVAGALKWLAQHQRPDGSWSFDHRHGPSKANPGDLADAYNGATGIVILPFLGAGVTHKEGTYKQTVKAGLAYLVKNMKLRDGKLGDLTDSGNMYSHGICAMALCEAYAMTNDRDLAAPAQAAINYIAFAQDPVGGGWRYQARQPGDTSVVGWQLMALKSAHMAYLNVSPTTIKGTSLFLDSVQDDSGAAYGYLKPGDSQATTSIGLLCRMHLGWKKDHGALERGVDRLAKIGPSKTNLYYNYYATQVLRQHGGERWKAWNKTMSAQLINTQSQDGAEAGSWYIPGDHGSDRGGRIYCTSMSTMTLEVYYRLPPLYRNEAADEEFPL